jgi:hypothetical protein
LDRNFNPILRKGTSATAQLQQNLRGMLATTAAGYCAHPSPVRKLLNKSSQTKKTTILANMRVLTGSATKYLQNADTLGLSPKHPDNPTYPNAIFRACNGTPVALQFS